nr:translation initiation factor IF-2-like [Oryctolagus cuniculus]
MKNSLSASRGSDPRPGLRSRGEEATGARSAGGGRGAHAARKAAAEQRGDAARNRDTRLGAAAEARLAWTALGRLFILNPYSVGVNSSNFIPAPDNVIVLLVTARGGLTETKYPLETFGKPARAALQSASPCASCQPGSPRIRRGTTAEVIPLSPGGAHGAAAAQVTARLAEEGEAPTSDAAPFKGLHFPGEKTEAPNRSQRATRLLRGRPQGDLRGSRQSSSPAPPQHPGPRGTHFLRVLISFHSFSPWRGSPRGPVSRGLSTQEGPPGPPPHHLKVQVSSPHPGPPWSQTQAAKPQQRVQAPNALWCCHPIPGDPDLGRSASAQPTAGFDWTQYLGKETRGDLMSCARDPGLPPLPTLKTHLAGGLLPGNGHPPSPGSRGPGSCLGCPPAGAPASPPPGRGRPCRCQRRHRRPSREEWEETCPRAPLSGCPCHPLTLLDLKSQNAGRDPPPAGPPAAR